MSHNTPKPIPINTIGSHLASLKKWAETEGLEVFVSESEEIYHLINYAEGYLLCFNELSRLSKKVKVYCSDCQGSMEERYASYNCPACDGKWLTLEEYIKALRGK